MLNLYIAWTQHIDVSSTGMSQTNRMDVEEQRRDPLAKMMITINRTA
jgi:hypothetical protein